MSFPEQFTGAPATKVQTRQTLHTSVCQWQGPRGLVFEKVHQDPARLQREYAALTTHAADLGCSPAVLGRSEDTLWLSALPGRTRSAEELPAAAWRAAGQWLRRAHERPVVTSDPLPLEGALMRRWNSLSKRARKVVAPAVVHACREIIGHPAHLATRRVWCHRDFTPDNWLWEPGNWSVLDFEHARPDEPWSDLVKLEADAFVLNPARRRAFYDGYGPNPHAAQHRPRVCWHGLATLTWGLRHGQAAFTQTGWRILGGLNIINQARGGDPTRAPR